MKLKKILVLATAVLSLQYNYAQVSASRTPVFTGSDDVTAVKQKKRPSVYTSTQAALRFTLTEAIGERHLYALQKSSRETIP